MEEIKQMVARKGFIEVFWHRIREDRAAGLETPYRQIYEAMEAEYEAEYGVRRWRSYDAFRMAKNRQK